MLYWHWIIFGIGLVLLELTLPSFTALWFGVAGILVGLGLLAFPEMTLTLQILSWTVLSVLMTFLWFKYLKPLSIDKTKAGLSREMIVGEVGQVQVVPHEDRRGTLKFPAPVLGADEWQFICTEDLQVGDRVRVIDVSGNSLIVTKA